MRTTSKRQVLVGAAIIALCVLPSALSAHPMVVDQSSVGPFESGPLYGIPGNHPFGQEFTPGLPTLDIVEVNTSDVNFGDKEGARSGSLAIEPEVVNDCETPTGRIYCRTSAVGKRPGGAEGAICGISR